MNVSIQLGSPASGDLLLKEEFDERSKVSIQLGSPASGDSITRGQLWKRGRWFPFNWDPQRVGTFDNRTLGLAIEIVSIQLGSPASGDAQLPFGG